MAKTLKMAKVHPNPNQPREYFDPEKLIELRDSIVQHGLMNAIEVRKRPDGDYEIVMGERRYRAAEMAGHTTIKVEIVDLPSDIAAFRRAMAENVNRHDMTALEEGRGYRRILAEDTREDGTPLTVEDVAKAFGKSPRYVKMRMDLLRLIPEVQERVTLGNIGTGAAHRISELTPKNQLDVLKKWAAEGLSENDLLHFAHQVREQQNQPSMFDIEELSDDEKKERIAAQRATRNSLDQIERTRALLEELARTPVEELAAALGGQLGARLDQLERVAKAIQDAKFQVRQAKAFADAKEIVVANTAVQPSLDDEDDERDPIDAELAEIITSAQDGDTQATAEGAAQQEDTETPELAELAAA
ncbi:ParB/RepB/Spo0J family partition protein [Kitasatospora sp. NBC_01287]|uniref:ParB/RepB/Spo0J family partition protein n=1 Tax=Kitasatospora sp. NBC_01287 TaxID=2903573 RepID=UPI00224FE4A1|nr:ParB/RepB/Spo0J family partition protein [Kitasatospora sp. NBC_01287]MCX4749138.1 ParB/RepB/Spo0J family partition protein [Kitasatospora sp. NBC_01287]